jgi:hypothetical protein
VASLKTLFILLPRGRELVHDTALTGFWEALERVAGRIAGKRKSRCNNKGAACSQSQPAEAA